MDYCRKNIYPFLFTFEQKVAHEKIFITFAKNCMQGLQAKIKKWFLENFK